MKPDATNLTNVPRGPARLWSACAAGLVGLGVLWAYAPTLTTLVRRWIAEPRHSHGFVVPALALVVWWVRHTSPERQRRDREYRPSWWGLGLLAGAALLRLAGAYFYIDWFDGLSLLPVILGFCLLAGGWPLFREAAPAVGLLVFMLPFPFQVEGMLSAPLQHLATVTSVYFLQTFGLPAVAEGNVIAIDDLKIGVLEACNGLGMLSVFFAISTAVALLLRRPLLDRMVVFLSAIPVGVLLNLVRITATGLVYAAVGDRAAQSFFHELAGWLMMPFALAALWLELVVLDRLFVPQPLQGERGASAPCCVQQGADAPRSPLQHSALCAENG
jgi:exosortase